MSAWIHPIIYVRGYAMTESERDETTADPFCGFNLGSTVYRATVDKNAPARKFVFESPVVRLSSDFGYRHVYQNGLDIVDPDWQAPPDEQGKDTVGIPSNSIVIYRYYESGSALLGDGIARDVSTYARGLNDLILRIRTLVGQREGAKFNAAAFRCYLVAHSMGGLIVRAFLQNPKLGDDAARRCVDKVFTYATPHNGIDLGGINVPSWLTLNEMKTFNRNEMAKYLAMERIEERKGRVDFMPESAFPLERFFCMVGTNRGDYEAGLGLSRTFAGHGSDGLVRVENASVWGVKGKTAKVTQPAATAYAYRSHSGHFGIVNSEEAYQNLVRFLFGDIRVDIWFDVDSVTLPDALVDKANDVEALYQFEILASPRGKRWYLTRRVSEEDSCACRTHEELTSTGLSANRNIYLSTVFLANRSRVNRARPGLSYSMTLGVKVPDYQVRKIFWADGHYEGRYLFQDTLLINMVPPAEPNQDWLVEYAWQSKHSGPLTDRVPMSKLRKDKLELLIPIESTQRPVVTGKIRLVASEWNATG
jgi:hypothetical protein